MKSNDHQQTSPQSQYSGTSINGHLVKAVIYRNATSIAGPERPPYVRNILLYS